MAEHLSKWDHLQLQLAKRIKEITRLTDELAWMERTPFSGECTGCGESLPTEADFAKHFLVSDPRYLNVGYCPKEENNENDS